MTRIAYADIVTSAPAGALFARWADVATWSQWNSDTEWVRLDGPFEQGVTGRLKPRGGPAVRFVVTSLVPGREFVDVSRLLGARLTFAHVLTPHADGQRVEVTVTLTGPLAPVWRRILGKGIAASVGADLRGLVDAAERSRASTA